MMALELQKIGNLNNDCKQKCKPKVKVINENNR